MVNQLPITGKTTLADVKSFLDQNAQDGSKVLAKKVGNATVLYVGKAKSNPFERIFGIATQRKQLAKTLTARSRQCRKTGRCALG